MRFDWKVFCEEHHIKYVTSGPNTAYGNISIHCPFCGDDDPSEHMGLSLKVERPAWGCWRSQMHRGQNPALLIAKLKGWNLSTTTAYIENQGANPDEFEAAVKTIERNWNPMVESVTLPPHRPEQIAWPKGVRQFDYKGTVQGRFTRYLQHRMGGLAYLGKWTGESSYPMKAIKNGVRELVDTYGLLWCPAGEYKDRIIMPVYHYGKVVTFTARAINKAVKRYDSLPDAFSVRNIKHCLYQRRELTLHKEWGQALVITEGPFDAMKVDFTAHKYGVAGVALFGKTISDEQRVLLGYMGKFFKKIAVCLDAEASLDCDTMCEQLSSLISKQVTPLKLPNAVKDPGELAREQVIRMLRQII